MSVKHTIATFREAIDSIQLHALGDASSKGVCTAVYAVVSQESGTSQGLITSKSWLSQKNLTIARRELVAGHMAVNLAVNVRNALQSCDPVVHCWLDSTVALCWIQGSGEYRSLQTECKRSNSIEKSSGATCQQIRTQQTWEVGVEP